MNVAYINREVSSLVVDVHRVVHSVHVRIHVARESPFHRVTFRGERSGVIKLGERHIVRARETRFFLALEDDETRS